MGKHPVFLYRLLSDKDFISPRILQNRVGLLPKLYTNFSLVVLVYGINSGTRGSGRGIGKPGKIATSLVRVAKH